MRYHLRRAASLFTALSILIGLPLAGGAWLSGGAAPEREVTEVLRASTTTAGSTATTADAGLGARLAAVPPPVPTTPEPLVGESVTEWICDIDGDNPRCLPTTTTHTHAAHQHDDAAGMAGKSQGAAAETPETQAAVEETETAAAPSESLEAQVRRAPHLERLVPLDPQGAEDWRPLISYFFNTSDVDLAVTVVECESRGVPEAKNPRSTASGLFQHLASMWPPRAASAGYAGADVFDPVANTAVAAWLVYEGGGWRHWNASRDCWG